jgi:hypothetical protein
MSVEYTVILGLGTNYQSQKISILNYSTNAFSTEYAILTNNNRIATFNASSSSYSSELAQIYLNIVPQTGMSGLVTYRFVRQTLIDIDVPIITE